MKKAKLRPEVSPKIQLLDLNCGEWSNALMPLKQQVKNMGSTLQSLPPKPTAILFAGLAKKLARRPRLKLIFREVSTPSKNMKLQGFAKFVLKTLVNWSYPMAAASGLCI